MSERILSPLQRGKARALEEATEAWKAEHASALMVLDVEEMIRLCASFPAEWRRSWNSVFGQMGQGPPEELLTAVEQVRHHFGRVLQALDAVGQMVVLLQGEGYQVANASDLARTVAELRAIRDQAFRHWPEPLTVAQVEEAKATVVRGEVEALDESFARAAGVEKEAWLRRVADYRLQRQDRR